MIHEDERRKLESFPEAKIITAKKDCVIGQHYHKIKTERFILMSGECELKWKANGNDGQFKLKIGELITIIPETYHEFEIKKDSVLIGINTHIYDLNDDYKP